MKLSRFITLAILAGALVLILSACGARSRPVEETTIALAPTAVLPLATTEPTATPMIAPSATPQPTASRTPTTTPTDTPTVTPTATATATPPNPLSVAYMREQAYPGSDIVIEQKLQPGANYQRYRASYLSEGLKQYALLTVPNGTPPATGWPAIVFNHGYIPPAQYRTAERCVAYVDGFARNGYVVFRPDYRGHDQSEGNASGGYGSPDYTIDVLNALSSVKRYAAVDPERIGMWGHSMGGHITLRSMVTSKDIKAGVIWAGVVASYPDLMSRWRRPVPVSVPTRARRWRDDFVAQYGSPESNPTFWASISPSSYLADLSGPLQLHHGTADESVPTEFSQTLYQQAQAAELSVPVEYYEYPGDNHNLSKSFNTAMQRSIAFFDKYVKNAAQPAAATVN
jgi:fermentation-respiration switch protein FrsA (DUF1100 family)